MHELFLDKEFLQRLEKLKYLSKKIFPGGMGGNRKGRRFGSGLEYADHREYNNGDDIRYVDWDLYARVEKIYTKLFVEDRDLNIHLLIDCSRSMDFGQPNKLKYSIQLSSALGYIGLSHLDHVGAGYFSNDLERLLAPRKGKNQTSSLFGFLSSYSVSNMTDLNRSMESFAAKVKIPGLVIIISDFLDEKGYEEGLRYLLFKKFEIHVFQILSPEEITPVFNGKVRLQNIEGDNYIDVEAKESISLYQKRIEIYNNEFKNFCDSHGIIYNQSTTDISFDKVLTRYFQKQMQ